MVLQASKREHWGSTLFRLLPVPGEIPVHIGSVPPIYCRTRQKIQYKRST